MNGERKVESRRSRLKGRILLLAGGGVITLAVMGSVFGIPIWKPNPIFVNAQNYSVQPAVTTNLPNVPNVTVGSPSWFTSTVACGTTGSLSVGPTTPAGADGAVLGVTSLTKCTAADFVITIDTTPAAVLTTGSDTITVLTTYNGGANSALMTEKVSVSGGTLTTGTYLSIAVDFGPQPSEVDTLTISVTGA